MRKQWKGFVSGVVVALLCVGMVGTAAATVGSRMLTAEYSDIKISVNGQQFTPKDANGNIVEPFAIGGTTYLPVRAVGDALGLSVSWDGNTGTVTLDSLGGTAQNLDAVLLMGFYKILEDKFDDLESAFHTFASGLYADFINYTMEDGPYTGMSYYSAVTLQIQQDIDLVEGHYTACVNLLTDEDVALMNEYRRLSGIVKSAYNTLAGAPTDAVLANITGAATQNSADCLLNEMTASALFWETYQAA